MSEQEASQHDEKEKPLLESLELTKIPARNLIRSVARAQINKGAKTKEELIQPGAARYPALDETTTDIIFSSDYDPTMISGDDPELKSPEGVSIIISNKLIDYTDEAGERHEVTLHGHCGANSDYRIHDSSLFAVDRIVGENGIKRLGGQPAVIYRDPLKKDPSEDRDFQPAPTQLGYALQSGLGGSEGFVKYVDALTNGEDVSEQRLNLEAALRNRGLESASAGELSAYRYIDEGYKTSQSKVDEANRNTERNREIAHIEDDMYKRESRIRKIGWGVMARLDTASLQSRLNAKDYYKSKVIPEKYGPTTLFRM